jgi:hypothetical protein
MKAARQYLDLDQQVFLTNFPGRHFRIGHHLCNHPLLELERLIDLASALPPWCIEYNSGDVEVSQHPALTPQTGLSVFETLHDMQTTGSWVVLKYAEHDPAYRTLLYECVRELSRYSELKLEGTHQLESYIFISSPGSITPFHFDDEHNFLLQIRGTKDMHAWSPDGAGAATQLDLERYYLGGHRNIPLRPNAPEADEVFKLSPGDGLHVPAHSPHWVQNGEQVSISYSVTFRSSALAREAVVHRFNGRLRRFGIDARPYGANAVFDNIKYWSARIGDKVSRRFRKNH